MKATGIVRKVDDLGRIVVPKEIRTNLGIDIGDPVEFYVDGQQVIMQKHDAAASVEQLLDRMEKELIMKSDLITRGQLEKLLGKTGEMKVIVNSELTQSGNGNGRRSAI